MQYHLLNIGILRSRTCICNFPKSVVCLSSIKIKNSQQFPFWKFHKIVILGFFNAGLRLSLDMMVPNSVVNSHIID